jgi:hypothetical protein
VIIHHQYNHNHHNRHNHHTTTTTITTTTTTTVTITTTSTTTATTTFHHRHHHYNHHARNSLSAADMILVCVISNLWFFLCLVFQHLKCTFDSSASVNMMMAMNVCITFATVMSTKFISHSHNSCLDVYDSSIHKVRNVFWSIRC